MRLIFTAFTFMIVLPTLSVEAILTSDAVLQAEARKLEVDAEAAAAPLRKADMRVELRGGKGKEKSKIV